MIKASRKILGITILLACLILLPLIAGDYTLQLVITVMVLSVLGLAFATCWKCGLIRVDIAAFWGIGAYTSALLMTKAGLSYWFSLPLGGFMAALLALVLASISIPRGPLVFFTLGFVFGLVVMQTLGAVKFFGGWGGIERLPSPVIGSFVFAGKVPYYYLGLFLLMLNAVTLYLLYDSRIGRAWKAIGSSPNLAKAMGIHVNRYRLAATVIGSFFVGLCGGYYGSYQGFIVPEMFGFYQSIYAQMYALVGGLNYFLAGPIIGAGVMVFMPEILRVTAEFEIIFSSFILIMVIIFLPQGILSLAFKLGNKIFRPK